MSSLYGMHCRGEATHGKTMTLAGPRAWTVDEVIALCEKYADARADVSDFLSYPVSAD